MTSWGRRVVLAATVMTLTGCGGAVASGARAGAADGGAQVSNEPGTPVQQPLFVTSIIVGPYCLPAALPVADGGGATSCYVLEELPGTNESVCDGTPGLSTPDPSIVAAVWASNVEAVDAPPPPLSQVAQLAVPGGGTCAASAALGWCYVTGADAAVLGCDQTIQVAPGTLPPGAKLWLACY
jgi:hypothetical protein